MTRPDDGPPALTGWTARHPVRAGVLFAVLYAATVLLGRATRSGGSPLAMVWPAAAVGFLWLADAWGAHSRRATTALCLGLLAAVVNALTGVPLLVGAAFGVANALQGWVTCAVVDRWRAPAGSAWRLRTPHDLAALVTGAAVGSVAAAGIGPVALWLASDVALLPAVGAWALRNGTSTFVFVALVLRVLDPGLVREPVARRGSAERVLLAALLVGAYAAVFGQPVHLPVAFLLLPLSLWAALRLSTTWAAAHVLLVGVPVVVLTLAGRGPFAVGVPATRVLLAQAFVTVVALVTLVLALQRDERRGLVTGLQEARREAAEQAALLRAVIDSTSEGISVFDRDGRLVLHNAAAQRLLGTSTSVTRPPVLTHLDGTALAPAERPLARALAGHDVPAVDLLALGAGEAAPRTLSVSAHVVPALPGSGWGGGAVLAYRDVGEDRAATAEVLRARDLFAGVLDAATEVAIIGADLDGRITLFNLGAERLLGHRTTEVLGTGVARLHVPAEVAQRAAELGVEPGLDVFTAGPRAGTAETRQWSMVRRDGGVLQVALTVTAMRDAGGALTGYMAMARDLTPELAARADLADSEQRFRLAFDTAPVGMMLVGLTGPATSAVLRVNSTLCTFLGRSQDELLSMDMHALTHVDEQEECRTSFAPFAAGLVTEARVEKRYQHRDGSTRYGLLSATAVQPGAGQEPYLLCLVEDVTARKQAEEALRHRALHDALTGLPNRDLFADRLRHALAAATRSGSSVGVVYLDLDGFKAVNDECGHAAGDELLQQVSARLSGALRPGDTLARLGGDEFAVVCVDVGQPHHAEAVAQRVLAVLAAPLPLASGVVTVGASLGVAVSGPASTAEDLVARADEAMYAAKRAGRGCVRVYDAEGVPVAS